MRGISTVGPHIYKLIWSVCMSIIVLYNDQLTGALVHVRVGVWGGGIFRVMDETG